MITLQDHIDELRAELRGCLNRRERAKIAAELDDGRKVYVEFPRGIARDEMPPLFIIGPEGKTSELVNYRAHKSGP